MNSTLRSHLDFSHNKQGIWKKYIILLSKLVHFLILLLLLLLQHKGKIVWQVYLQRTVGCYLKNINK